MKKLISYLGSALSFLILKTPWFLKHYLCWTLAILFFDLLCFRRKIVFGNLDKIFPMMPTEEKISIARESYYHLWYNFIEFCQFPAVNENWCQKNIEFKGIENLENAVAQNKGVLFLSLHMGHGDLAVSMIARQGYQVNLISKHFSNKFANDFWFRIRSKFGVKFIDPHGSKTPFEILKSLKNKEIVVFVLDQYMGPPYGVETTFFGQKTGTAYGLALFALKSESPVITVHAERLSKGRFRIHFDPQIPFQTIEKNGEVDRDSTVLLMTQNYNHVLEKLVEQYPRHWMWIHRRFKPFYSPPL